ncbi:hypothetical protein LA080_013419 [Diaporthe eres]|uniref:DUF7719 domain-containing protein n=1 Tax=Diaporthe vaccinii TaxID=105482 RepID=A0ABR4F4R6_9PEZI|nr:hypothetical protein LA080_013419 [Diaporthe eres]
MVRERKEKRAKNIKLKQPDRSGPTEKTLFDIAQERNLFKQAAAKERKNKRQNGEGVEDDEDDDEEEGIPPGAERILETLLYTVSLTMLHLTLDVLVQQQYAIEIEWFKIIQRDLQALMVFTALVYALHPHAAATTVVPGLPQRFQNHARQAIFLAMGTVAGCYLIHITNKYSYIAVLKQAPALGCLWVWSIIELNLGLAVASLAASGFFFWQGGYTIR